MKKILILTNILALGCLASNANPAFNPQFINSVQTLQGQHFHDMESFKEQKFKHEEINELKDIKEQKEKKLRELEGHEQQINRIIHQTPEPQRVQFKEENGEIKIENK